MIEINFEITNTPNIIYRDIDLSCIYLYPKYFVRKISGYVTEDKDPEEYFLEDVCIAIEHIAKIGMFYHQFNEQYYVSVQTTNGSDTDTYFDTFEEADKVYRQIKNWRFGV